MKGNSKINQEIIISNKEKENTILENKKTSKEKKIKNENTTLIFYTIFDSIMDILKEFSEKNKSHTSSSSCAKSFLKESNNTIKEENSANTSSNTNYNPFNHVVFKHFSNDRQQEINKAKIFKKINAFLHHLNIQNSTIIISIIYIDRILKKDESLLCESSFEK